MKYTIQITRWEPWVGDIDVEADSKTAAKVIAREKAKRVGRTEGRFDFEYDSSQTPKISITGIVTHSKGGETK